MTRIAILDDATEAARGSTWARLRNRLGELGFVEGKNVVFETRYAEGVGGRMGVIAAELAASKPDVIVTPGTTATRALLRATSTVPIVFTGAGDPVGTGLVASLARPGGNATGVSIMSTETTLKAFELLRELFPAAKRIAYLTDAAGQAGAVAHSRLEERARAAKISIRMLDGVGPVALGRSFETIRRDKIQALIVGVSGALLDQKEGIVRFAAQEKLLVVYGRIEYVRAGGLMSYGVERSGRPLAAEYVQKILNGAKPSDLPVQQISKFELSLNLSTARTLGIRIPESIRLRATEVIE